jgi:hypothetical protein
MAGESAIGVQAELDADEHSNRKIPKNVEKHIRSLLPQDQQAEVIRE